MPKKKGRKGSKTTKIEIKSSSKSLAKPKPSNKKNEKLTSVAAFALGSATKATLVAPAAEGDVDDEMILDDDVAPATRRSARGCVPNKQEKEAPEQKDRRLTQAQKNKSRALERESTQQESSHNSLASISSRSRL